MKTTLFILLAPVLLFGQDKGTILPYPGPNYTEIKQYLNLTDTQLQSLQSIVGTYNQAQNKIYEQISQKYQTLYDLMGAGTGTALQLGQLLLDIQNLQKQLPSNDDPYRTQALNVLTADQKAKLPKLIEATQLQMTAGEAGSLLLIDAPRYVALTAASSMGVLTPASPLNPIRLPANRLVAPPIR